MLFETAIRERMLLLTNVCCNFVYTECIQKSPRMDAAIRRYVAKRPLSVPTLDAHRLDRPEQPMR